MARADLLLRLVRAGKQGDQAQLRRAVETLISEERGKHHHVLADRLSTVLNENGQYVSRPAGPAASGAASVEDLLFEVIPRRQLSELILPAAVRSSSEELIEEQHRADLLRAHNIEPRHRVLLAGPPGNGKTTLAEAIAEALMVPLLVVRYEGVIGSYLGETSSRLRRVFDYVRTRQCVLFFDEFDAVGKERGDVHETGEIKRVVSSLLLQIDDLPSFVTVITASNHPELLDRAVWRRFQLRLELPPPTREQIIEWFDRLEERIGESLTVNKGRLADQLAGLSFAELEDFSLDVQRRLVLGSHDAHVERIVKNTLAGWASRFAPPNH